MDNQGLNKILSLAARTGEKFIINYKDKNFILLNLDDYEKLIGSKEDQLDELTEDELIDKINNEISDWRESQVQDQETQALTDWRDLDRQTTEKPEILENEDHYYLEPVN